METVAPEWEEVAVALGFDGTRIKVIRTGTHYQPRKACLEMFTEWLDGGHDLQPPTWDILITSLRAANLMGIANLLSHMIVIVSLHLIIIVECTTMLSFHAYSGIRGC